MEPQTVVYQTHPHWSETEDRAAFVQAVADLGLDGHSIPAILGVDRVGQFPGTAQEALDMLTDYAAQQRQERRDNLRPQLPIHGEAQAIAWTNAFLPDGTPINITARHGAAPDDIVSTVLALTDALATLKTFGVRTVKFPPRVTPTVAHPKAAPDSTEFWTTARAYIGAGRAFNDKAGVANWLSQFATGNGYEWGAAIKALYGLNQSQQDAENDSVVASPEY